MATLFSHALYNNLKLTIAPKAIDLGFSETSLSSPPYWA